MLLTARPFFDDALSSDEVAHTEIGVYLDQLAYCCLRTPAASLQDTAQRISRMQHEDQSQLLSGLLMWDGRLMIHWLEGERRMLDKLWCDIQNDPHHHCLVLLNQERGVARRVFRRWEMCQTSRNEMRAVVRELRSRAQSSSLIPDTGWIHAMSTLSILLNQDFAPLYAHRTENSSGHAQDMHTLQAQQPWQNQEARRA
jgi:hypothetical protein